MSCSGGRVVMTENSDKVSIALVGPDDVEFCSPPVSTARGAPRPAGARPGRLRVYDLHRAWEVGANSGAQMRAWGGAPTRVRVQRPGHPQMRAKRTVGRERGGGVEGEDMADGGAATLNREESAQRPSRPEDQGPAARGARRNGAPAGARGAVPHPNWGAPMPRPLRAALTRPLPGCPQAYAVTVKPSSPARLLKVGAVVLISGAVLLPWGPSGLLLLEGSDNHVSPEAYRAAGAPGSLACPSPRGGPQGRCCPLGASLGTSVPSSIQLHDVASH